MARTISYSPCRDFCLPLPQDRTWRQFLGLPHKGQNSRVQQALPFYPGRLLSHTWPCQDLEFHLLSNSWLLDAAIVLPTHTVPMVCWGYPSLAPLPWLSLSHVMPNVRATLISAHQPIHHEVLERQSTAPFLTAHHVKHMMLYQTFPGVMPPTPYAPTRQHFSFELHQGPNKPPSAHSLPYLGC